MITKILNLFRTKFSLANEIYHLRELKKLYQDKTIRDCVILKENRELRIENENHKKSIDLLMNSNEELENKNNVLIDIIKSSKSITTSKKRLKNIDEELEEE